MLDRLRRSWAASLCAATLVVSVAGFAQSQAQPQSAQSAALPASNAVAVTAVRRALAAMGGENTWAAVRSSRVQASMCPAMGNAACAQRTFVDDWSGPYPRYKHGNQTYRQNPITASDGSRSYWVKFHEQSYRMPEYDAPRVFMGHLPGAALAYVLDHPKQYVLRIAPPPSPLTRPFPSGIPTGVPAASGLIEVDVLRLLAANGPGVEEQQWFFLEKTGLPSFARVRMPNLLNGRGVWQRFDYVSWAQGASGLLTPSQVKLSIQGMATGTLNLSSAEMNPALSDADFAFGGQQ